MASTTDDDSRIECCPECKSGRFCVRGSAMGDNPLRSDKQYYCKECRHDFDEPATKQGQKQVPRRGLAADLMRADPEEVSR